MTCPVTPGSSASDAGPGSLSLLVFSQSIQERDPGFVTGQADQEVSAANCPWALLVI